MEVDVIGKDIYQVSKKYLLVDDDKEKESTVIRLGRKIVRLLSSIWKRFKDLRILSSATNTDFRDSLDTKASLTGINYSVSKNRNTISLFTTFNLVDELDYGYPILGIEKEDVKIRELVGNDKIDVEIIDVSSLDESVNIYVCLLIDCSTSMKDNNKIGYAKDAAINLVKGFFNSKSGLNIHFSIYPVTSINDYGFHYFDEGRQWSNSFKELHQAINSLAPNGDTPLLDALNSTLQYIDDQNGYKYIICVSDGADNISATDYANIFKEVQKRETPIFSIGYGEEEHLSGLVSISELSKAGIQGQGSFMKVHPNELINVFSYLGSVVNNAYRVIWKPSKYEMGKVRKFELSVEINSTDKNKTLITFYNLEYRMK